ncbi:MAG: sulfite exporter TauE/SafE family protein [Rhodospirillales bacterium]|nr:sulfite exporter TauE/SafE family protein [Rhodospirillales bacterium]
MSVAGIPLYPELALSSFLLLIVIYFFGFFVKGALGMGAMTPTVLFGAWVIGAHHAVLLALVCNLFSQVQFLPEGFRYGDRAFTLRAVVPLFAAIALGVWIFGRLDDSGLELVVGFVLGGIVLLDATGLSKWIEARFRGHPSLFIIAATISGLISGIIGAGGLFILAAFLKVVCPEPRKFRATMLLIITLAVIWRATTFAVGGFITPQLLLESAVLIPAIVAGGWVGMKFFHSISADRFNLFFRIFLIAAAASLMWRGLVKLF